MATRKRKLKPAGAIPIIGPGFPAVDDLGAMSDRDSLNYWVRIQNNIANESDAFKLKMKQMKSWALALYPKICTGYDLACPNGNAFPIGQHNLGLQYKVQTIKPRLNDEMIMRAAASYFKTKQGLTELESLRMAGEIMAIIEEELNNEANFTTKKELVLMPIENNVPAKRPLAADIYVDPHKEYIPSRTKKPRH